MRFPTIAHIFKVVVFFSIFVVIIPTARSDVDLVKDINLSGESLPRYLTNVNGTLFFAADDGIHGAELWKSDGTEASTVMVEEIDPDILGPSDLTNVDGTLFFTIDDGIKGRELWKSDGTAAGTVVVRNINLSGSTSFRELTDVNGTLFFAANTGTLPGNEWPELWKSDGTEVGTIMVKDLDPGFQGSSNKLTNVNGTLFFTLNDGLSGRELWKSDGTFDGTVMVKDINTNPDPLASSIPSNLTDMNGTLFFSADDGINGKELWRSDGTDEGTIIVKDINPTGDAFGGANDYFTIVNGTLFFAADDGIHGGELWKSDGTEEGTLMVKDVYPGFKGGGALNPINVDGELFFGASYGVSQRGLWKSDGTQDGTVLVRRLTVAGVNGSFGNPVNVNGTVIFFSDNLIYGNEIWKSDGTEAGTVVIRDINPSGDCIAAYPTNVNGTVFFGADDGIHGFELWKAYPPWDPCEADYDGERDVDGIDLGSFGVSFPSDPISDLNADGIVEDVDFEIFCRDFGRVDCPEF